MKGKRFNRKRLLLRSSCAEQAGLDRTSAEWLQKLAGKQGLAQTELAGELATERQGVEFTFREQQAELLRDFETTIQKGADKQSMGRLTEEYRLQRVENEAQDADYRTPYADGKRQWTDPVTGIAYEWATNQNYDLIREAAMEQRIHARMRLEASLRDSDLSVSEFYAKYQLVRDDILKLYGSYWSEGTWIGIPDEQLKTKILLDFDNIVDAMLAAKEIDATAAEAMKSSMKDYLSNAQVTPDPELEPPPEEAGTGGRPGLLSIDYQTPAAQRLSEMGGVPGLAAPIAHAFEQQVGMSPEEVEAFSNEILGNAPPAPAEGVTSQETDFYNRLSMALGNPDLSPEQKAEARTFVTEIERSGYLAETDFDIWDAINEFLREFQPSGTRTQTEALRGIRGN